MPTHKDVYLGDGYMLHTYEDGNARIRRESEHLMGGTRFNQVQLQKLVDGLIESGVVVAPADKLAQFLERCDGRIKSVRRHLPEDEEAGIYVVMHETTFCTKTASRVQEYAEEVFGVDVRVWIEKEVRSE
jgi:hypothetical protein